MLISNESFAHSDGAFFKTKLHVKHAFYWQELFLMVGPIVLVHFITNLIGKFGFG